MNLQATVSDRPQPLEIIKEGSESRGHGEGLWGPGTLTLGAVHISVPSSRSVVWSWGGGVSSVIHTHTAACVACVRGTWQPMGTTHVLFQMLLRYMLRARSLSGGHCSFRTHVL